MTLTAAPGRRNALLVFREAVRFNPDGTAIHYFDSRLSYGELDAASDALAAWLLAGGVRAGDRLALYLQNSPGFVIGLLAGWKAGAIPVPINPMNRRRELSVLLADCTPAAMVCQDTLLRDVVDGLPGKPKLIVTTDARDFQGRNDARLFIAENRLPPGPDTLPAISASGGTVPDLYRGETVKAVVSLKPGQAADAAELIAFCRERMAAYKYPRLVDVVADLPKTATGKILRRALRDEPAAQPDA